MFRKLTDNEINEAFEHVKGLNTEEIFDYMQKSPSVSLCMLFSSLRKNAFEYLPYGKFDKILICDACMAFFADVFVECESLSIVEGNNVLRDYLKTDKRNIVYNDMDSIDDVSLFDTVIYLGNDRAEAMKALAHLKENGQFLSSILLDADSKFECVYLSPDAIYPKEMSLSKNDGSLLYLYGKSDELPIFVKYSDERADYRNIKTEIRVNNSKRFVYKKSMSQTPGYLNEIYENYLKLSKKFEGVTGFEVVPASFTENSLMFPFIEGDNLSDILYKCFCEDRGNFKRYLKKYHDLVTYNEEAEFTDLDLIFGNIIVDDKGTWHIIDSEWCEEGLADESLIIFRALYNFGLEHKISDEALDEFYNMFDIHDELRNQYKYNEAVFQKRVTGAMLTTDELIMFAKTGVCPVPEDMLYELKNEIKLNEELAEFSKESLPQRIKNGIQDILIKRCIQKYNDDYNSNKDVKTISVVAKSDWVELPSKETMNRGMIVDLNSLEVKGNILSLRGEMYVPNQNNARYSFGIVLTSDDQRGIKIELPLLFATEEIKDSSFSLRRIIDADIFLPKSEPGSYMIYGFAYDKCSRQKIYRKTDSFIEI